MSTSAIEYRGREFMVNDSIMQVWLHLLIDEIRQLDSHPPWLATIQSEWETQVSGGLAYVNPGLDRVITTPEQLRIIISLSENALRKLENHGNFIGADELNAMGTGEQDSFFTGDVPTWKFEQTGRFFVKLLKGELRLDEIDARFAE